MCERVKGEKGQRSYANVKSKRRGYYTYIYNIFLLSVAALSAEERALFSTLIKRVEMKIKPGLAKLTWNTDYVDTYMEDCRSHTAKVYIREREMFLKGE